MTDGIHGHLVLSMGSKKCGLNYCDPTIQVEVGVEYLDDKDGSQTVLNLVSYLFLMGKKVQADLL